MKIIKEIKNDLLKRKEIQFVIEAEKNPGLDGSKRILVDRMKTSEDNVAVKFVKSKFGTNEFLIEAFIYGSKQDKERIEPKQKEKKKACRSPKTQHACISLKEYSINWLVHQLLKLFLYSLHRNSGI